MTDLGALGLSRDCPELMTRFNVVLPSEGSLGLPSGIMQPSLVPSLAEAAGDRSPYIRPLLPPALIRSGV